MVLKENLEVKNKLGLHARAAARLVNVTERFKADILLERNGMKANGKSLLEILTLACPMGSQVTVLIEGVDADDALDAVKKLFEDKFFEE